MKNAILTQLEKKANVSRRDYDFIHSHINDNGSKIITRFYVAEIVGGCRRFFEVGFASTLLLAVCKREEDYNDYITNGIEDRCYLQLS